MQTSFNYSTSSSTPQSKTWQSGDHPWDICCLINSHTSSSSNSSYPTSRSTSLHTTRRHSLKMWLADLHWNHCITADHYWKVKKTDWTQCPLQGYSEIQLPFDGLSSFALAVLHNLSMQDNFRRYDPSANQAKYLDRDDMVQIRCWWARDLVISRETKVVQLSWKVKLWFIISLHCYYSHITISYASVLGDFGQVT